MVVMGGNMRTRKEAEIEEEDGGGGRRWRRQDLSSVGHELDTHRLGFDFLGHFLTGHGLHQVHQEN